MKCPPGGEQVKLRANAKMAAKTREELVDRVPQQEWDIESVAEAAGVSTRTVWKWLRKYREEGAAGVSDPAGTLRTPTRSTTWVACGVGIRKAPAGPELSRLEYVFVNSPG